MYNSHSMTKTNPSQDAHGYETTPEQAVEELARYADGSRIKLGHVVSIEVGPHFFATGTVQSFEATLSRRSGWVLSIRVFDAHGVGFAVSPDQVRHFIAADYESWASSPIRASTADGKLIRPGDVVYVRTDGSVAPAELLGLSVGMIPGRQGVMLHVRVSHRKAGEAIDRYETHLRAWSTHRAAEGDA